MGLTVPCDISVVGFDDSRAAWLPHIDLTTVHQDITGTVEAAVESVIERLDDGRTDAKHVVCKTLCVPITASMQVKQHGGTRG